MSDLYALVTGIRRAFHALGALGDQLHRDLEVTAAMRAVLEALVQDGPRTVPEIARSKRVSRQHIQQIANALYAAGLAEARPNARHQRSPVVAATARGSTLFTEMRRREQGVLAQIAAELGANETAAAALLLATLNASLERRLDHVDD